MRRVLSTLLGVLTALGSTLVMGTIPVAAAGCGGGSYTADYYTDGGRAGSYAWRRADINGNITATFTVTFMIDPAVAGALVAVADYVDRSGPAPREVLSYAGGLTPNPHIGVITWANTSGAGGTWRFKPTSLLCTGTAQQVRTMDGRLTGTAGGAYDFGPEELTRTSALIDLICDAFTAIDFNPPITTTARPTTWTIRPGATGNLYGCVSPDGNYPTVTDGVISVPATMSGVNNCAQVQGTGTATMRWNTGATTNWDVIINFSANPPPVPPCNGLVTSGTILVGDSAKAAPTGFTQDGDCLSTGVTRYSVGWKMIIFQLFP